MVAVLMWCALHFNCNWLASQCSISCGQYVLNASNPACLVICSTRCACNQLPITTVSVHVCACTSPCTSCRTHVVHCARVPSRLQSLYAYNTAVSQQPRTGSMFAKHCKALSTANTTRAVCRWVAHSRKTPLVLPFVKRRLTSYAISVADLAASDAQKLGYTEAHIPVLLPDVLQSFADSSLKVSFS